jgi:hypothetical protein
MESALKINKSKFYLPFLAEGASSKESTRPRGSVDGGGTPYRPDESNFSDCGLKQVHTKPAITIAPILQTSN